MKEWNIGKFVDDSEQPGSADSSGVNASAVLPPLQLNGLTVDTPIILAPMAGITNAAFRRLCREYGGGLHIAEMVTSRALVERNKESMRIIAHDQDEKVRSVQLYGVDPDTVGKAVKILVEEDRCDHIDLNFGCPVPKVTRKGGGAALPWKRDLFKDIVTRAVKEASGAQIPVTIKMRKGIDDEHLTYIDAGRIARNAGVAAVALHGRTASDYYSGKADWDAIGRLREELADIPVLGNGDIWSAEDAVAMVKKTGVDGVVVGRGCQGRPWIFGDLHNAFSGNPERFQPTLGEVAKTLYYHAQLLVRYFDSEFLACRDIRKHIAWYFKGYRVGSQLRRELAMVKDLQILAELLGRLESDTAYPGLDAEGPRGRAGSPKKTVLPEGWLDSQSLNNIEKKIVGAAEIEASGG